MKKFVAVFLVTSLHLVFSQQCQQITVCGDGLINNGGEGRREKGSVGAPGKVGPPGGKGPKGESGEDGPKGVQGESCALGLFETEMRRNFMDLKQLLTPASCVTSSLYGKQVLRSGEEVFCDGGWTVFQQRFDGSVNFDQNWNMYKTGFGDFDSEFWIGLDKIHNHTKRRGCKLRIDIWDFADDHAFAEYSSFSVENETGKFRLHVGGYSGTAGDSLLPSTTSEQHNNNLQFTTKDMDHDKWNDHNCATQYGVSQGGWWFSSCGYSRLNAHWGPAQGSWRNALWYHWKSSSTDSLKATTMKLRCD